jgi:hypothetical protein
MAKLHSPSTFDWQVSLGRDLYTADNQHIGIVESVRTDPRSGKTFLIVTGPDTEKPLCIPVETIGIISRFRLMLDLSRNRAPFGEWQQADCSDSLPA